MGNRKPPASATTAGKISRDTQPPTLAALLLIAMVTLVVFAPIFANSFTTWDDADTIAHNPSFNPPTAGSILSYWARPHMDLYVPVTYQLWGILAAVAHGQPERSGIALRVGPFHAANLAIHLASAVLVFLLIRDLLPLSGNTSPPQSRTWQRAQWPAAIGAILFAVHPVQAEAVAWLSGTKDLLCGMFCILALLAYFRGHGSQHPVRWYALATVGLILALLSKPTAVVVPLLALALDLLLRRKLTIPRLLLLAGWFAAAATVAIIAKLVQPATSVVPPALYLRPLVAADALSFYLRQLLFPSQLCVDYGRTPDHVLTSAWSYLAPLAPAAAASIVGLYYRKTALLAVACVLFVGPLLPLLGLVPFDFQEHSTVTDHYLYLPMLGIALAAALLIFANWQHRRVVLTVASLALLLLAIRTSVQLTTWRTTRALFEHVLSVNPRSWAACNSLAEDALNSGETSRAAELATRGLQYAPNYPELHVTLGVVEAAKGNLDAALQHYSRALAIEPTHANAMASIAAIKAQRGNMPEAISLVRKAIEIKPSCALAHSNYAVMLAQSGDLPSAANELELAVRYDSSDVGAQLNLAAILWELGRYAQARQHLSLALKMRPDDPRAQQMARDLR